MKKLLSLFTEETWLDRAIKNQGWLGVLASTVVAAFLYAIFYYYPNILSFFGEEITEARHQQYMFTIKLIIAFMFLIESLNVYGILKVKRRKNNLGENKVK